VQHPHASIIWVHGGGFVTGSIDESDGYTRVLALATGCAVAAVDYRLAPEHKFPVPLKDVIAATLWVAQRRAELAGGEVPLVLAGDSAGANLATVATRKLHRARVCSIAANVLAYPCTENHLAPSLRAFVPPFLKADEVLWCFDQYLPDEAARDLPDFAPSLAPDLALLPPTLIITAEHDLITAQALAYGRKLAAENVSVRFSHHAGMIHGFLTLEPFFAGAAGVAMGEISDFIKTIAP
jgi:acetyl esterase